MNREMQYERQSIVAVEATDRNKKPREMPWERVSERDVKHILNDLELRISLQAGKVIETCRSRWRMVARPDFETFRLTRQYNFNAPFGYTYLKGQYSIVPIEKKGEPVRMKPQGPGIKARHLRKWTCEPHELEKLEKRLYRMALKQGILFNVLH